MIKRIIFSVLLLLCLLYCATWFYKLLFTLLILFVWRKTIAQQWPQSHIRFGVNALMGGGLVVLILILAPRWRINTSDRTRLIYIDKQGETYHIPMLHYLLSTMIPEEEIENLGVRNVGLFDVAMSKHIGNSLIAQAKHDFGGRSYKRFLSPYKQIDGNPAAAIYAQFMNTIVGTKHNCFYLCKPTHYNKSKTYPLIVFCHGFLGNWKLYQGILGDFDNAIVLSIGTTDLSGIFNQSDIGRIFSFYIPALERMGYKIDHKQLHLVGLSNGGSAISSTMHSKYSSLFQSITSVSCNLNNLSQVSCRVNLVGGGNDNSSKRMPSQCKQLKEMGVDAEIFFDKDETHYILINKQKEIVKFLRNRMRLDLASTN